MESGHRQSLKAVDKALLVVGLGEDVNRRVPGQAGSQSQAVIHVSIFRIDTRLDIFIHFAESFQPWGMGRWSRNISYANSDYRLSRGTK